jgi:hypothetical protein
MQTKFYFLLGLLVGLTSVSSTSVAQTACFGYDSGDNAVDGFQLHVEPFATFDGSESSPEVAALAGHTTYRIYLETPSAADFVNSVRGGGGPVVEITTSTSFYMNDFGGLTVNDINPGLFGFFPALEFDSFVTIGLSSEAEGSQSSIILQGEDNWGPSFLAGGNLSINGSNASDGDGWYVPVGATNGFAGDDNMVMLAQVTTDGVLNGTMHVSFVPDGMGPETVQMSFSSETCGCTDESAANYVAGATLDDGSCIYPGCTDSTACNYESMANEDDGSCDYCCLAVVSENDAYGLELDLHNPSGIPGLRTYRLYVTTANPTDAISAVTGLTDVTPLAINTTTDFYQWQGAGGGVTPNNWNPLFGSLPGFENGAFDSYVTIGLTQTANADAGENAVEVVEDLATGPDSDPWIADFEAGGNISTSNAAGGGWFMFPGYTNAIAGDDNRVLIGQFTTDGLMSGGMFVQIFPEGDQNESIEFYMSFTAPNCACTDESACNYDANATWDDGSCQDGPAYWGENITCDGECLNDADGDYVCDEDEIEGCLNPAACNYVPGDIVTELIPCEFPDDYLTCEGDCINDVDGDGVCDENELGGCLDATACNYDDTATEENGTCVYLESITLGEVPSSSIAQCSLFEDGPNNTWQHVLIATTPDDANSNQAQTLDLSMISLPAAGTNYRVAKTTANGNWYFGPALPLELGANSITVTAVSFARSVKFQFSNGDGEFDSVAINGNELNDCTSSEAQIATCDAFEDGPNSTWQYVLVATTASDENSNAAQSFEMEVTSLPSEGVNFRVAKTTANGSWFFSNPEPLVLGTNTKTVAGVSFARSVKFQFQSGEVGFSALEVNGEDANTCGGLLEAIVYDCDGECFNDTDGDGVCDEVEIPGCTDESACNYDGTYTEEDGSCDYCCAATASVEGYNISIEAVQETPNGTQYRMYVETPNATDKLSAVVGDSTNPTYINSTQSIYRTGINTDVTANVVNPAFFPLFPSLEWDSWVTIGIDSFVLGANESIISTIESTDWVAEFNAGNGITMEGEFGDGWFVLPNVSNGVSGDDQRVLVGQFTTAGVLSGQIFVQMFPEGDSNNSIEVHLPFGYATDDDEAPVFTSVPADISQSCSDAYPTEMAIAVDAGCFPEAVVTVSEEVMDADCGYTLIRTFTATDAFGNSATASQTVQLLDSENPVAVAQADFTAQCSDDLTPGAGIAEYPTDSYDNCASDLEFSYVDAPYSPGFDLTGATADFNVEMGFDFGGPFGASLILNADAVTIGDGAELTYEDLTENPASHRGAIAVDIDGSTINLSVEGTSGTPFAYDYAHVNISNISSGNISTVTIDSNAIAAGADVSVSTTENSITISWMGNASYAEGDAATASVLSPSTCLENGGVMRTWTVTDDCGNTGSAVQYITIIDTEGPTFTSTPQNMELNCNEAIPMGMPVAEDCGAVTMSAPVDATTDGSCGTSYTIQRTWTATDACGNSSDFTQTIMVTDLVAPEFTSFPEDVTYTSGEDVTEVMPTATDDCNEVTIDFTDSVDNSNVEITVITRSWTATDACGNEATQDQTITVNEILGCMDALACNFNDSASYDDGSCDFCSCGSGGEAGFGLELELVETHDGSIDGLGAGMSTYRVYVTTPTADDFVSAVSGDSNNPSFLNTSTSFYQDSYGGITPDNINPLFFTVVPSLNYDSWLTIGIEGVAGAGESAITVVQAPDDNWVSAFNDGGNLELNSFFGGSWFALITSSNGFAGEDQRVLVAQLTTDGDVSGQLYVQVFPNGDQSQDTYLTLSFGGNECGCLDATACNFSDEATYDDGSCAYAEFGYDCEGVCLGDSDEDGVCDDLEIFGCTVEGNCNYDPAATELDESMCAVSPFCIGCNDEAACNFNPNVIPEPNFNDGSCTYPDAGFDCAGDCLDLNGDLICDLLQGCADESACNYEDNIEYPSLDFCDFCSCLNVASSQDGYGIDVESMASDVEGATTYHVYVTTANSTDVLNAILGNAQNPITLASSSEIYQSGQGSYLPSSPELFGFYPLLASDSYVTIGGNTPSNVINLPPTENGGVPSWVTDFEGGGNIIIDDVVGSGWYINADFMNNGYGLAGDDNRVLVAQITTPGTIHGELFVQIFPEGLSAGNTLYVSLSFGSDNCGCADETACNYSEENYEDDGSCYYPIDGEGCSACLYDEVAPIVVASEDYTTACADVDTDIRQPLATDECDPLLDVAFSDALTTGDCEGAYTIERTWTFTDNAGNSVSAVQVINVVDTTAPEFTAPANVSIACTDDINDLELTGDVLDAVDDCGTSVTVSYSDAAGVSNCFEGDAIVRTWTATDDCGNSSSADQLITLVDAVAPFFTSIPEDVELECADALPMDMATAEDVCSGVTVTFSDSEGDANCTGMAVITRTFTATDGCGNVSTAQQTITRIDTEAPVASVADASMTCEEYDSATEYGSYEVSDNCMSEVVVSWAEVSNTQEGSNGCFVAEREYTFTDGCGNSSSVIQTITVTDDVAPVMDEVAAAVELQCGDVMPAMPSATDNCSAVEVTFEDVETTMGCSGEMNFIRTYTATDACGNSVSASQEVTYNDVIAPTFTAPSDVTVECDSDLSDLGVTGNVMDASDVCSADIFMTYTDEVSTSEGSCLADNVVTRTWTVTDGCGNSSTDVQVITLEDTTAPVVVYEASITLYDSASENIDDFEGISEVFDACSDYTYTTTDIYSGSGIYSYQLNRTMVFTDACGNSTTIEQLVTAIYSTGCTYADAMNFDSAAIIDDGSCVYEGCTDDAAANYNPVASVDDGTCVTVGCMDPAGYDYDPSANFPGGCDYPDPCPGDINDDGMVNVSDLLEFFQLYGVDCPE